MTADAVATQPAAGTTTLRRSTQLCAIAASVCFFVFVMAMSLMKRDSTELSISGTYWASGRALSKGLNPYTVYPETYRLNYAPFGGAKDIPDLNLNPPCVLPAFQALSFLPVRSFITVWMLVTGLFVYLSVALILWHHPNIQGRQVLWLLLAQPAINTVAAGQVYGIAFLCATLAWIFQRQNRHLAAAIFIGLVVAIRPTMIFWPALLFVAGERRLALRSLAATAVAYALPLLLYGPVIYRQWLAAFANDPHWIDPRNIALVPFFMRFGLRLVGILGAAALALFLARWALKKKPNFDSASGASVCAGILCAPLGWDCYLLFLSPMFVARRWTPLAMIAAAILMVPVTFLSSFYGVPLLIAALIILGFFLSAPAGRGLATET